jgi:hypothetical protein
MGSAGTVGILLKGWSPKPALGLRFGLSSVPSTRRGEGSSGAAAHSELMPMGWHRTGDPREKVIAFSPWDSVDPVV